MSIFEIQSICQSCGRIEDNSDHIPILKSRNPDHGYTEICSVCDREIRNELNPHPVDSEAEKYAADLMDEDDQEYMSCDHCQRNEKDDNIQIVDYTSDTDAPIHGYYHICTECDQELIDEFSGPATYCGDESEEDFWDHEDEDGPYGRGD